MCIGSISGFLVDFWSFILLAQNLGRTYERGVERRNFNEKKHNSGAGRVFPPHHFYWGPDFLSTTQGLAIYFSSEDRIDSLLRWYYRLPYKPCFGFLCCLNC